MSNGENGAEKFGRWLELTMENRGIRGQDLAKRLKVHPSAISKWKSGGGAPATDTCLRLAQVLNVDPLRLAVLAGQLDGEIVNVRPLPMPEPTAQRAAVKEQLRKIRGLTARERQVLIDTYDEESARNASGGE